MKIIHVVDNFHQRHLAEVAHEKFVRGVVLYSGEKVVPFGENLFAVPLSALWA